jgi:hypothetical protein
MSVGISRCLSRVSQRLEFRQEFEQHVGRDPAAPGAGVVATDNRRHFLSALRYGLRVEPPAELLATVKKKPR